MKVPANVSADKLILDYLARVTEAGTRYLPKGSRLAFVAKTKARIERECGDAGTGDVERVRAVLAGLGEPEELVRQERAHIDAEWVKRRARQKAAADAAAQAPDTEITEPLQHRPLTSRWRPATDAHLSIPAPTWHGHAGHHDPHTGPHDAATGPGEAAGPAAGPEPSVPPQTGPQQTARLEPAAPPGSYPDRPVSYPLPPRGSADPRRVEDGQEGAPPGGQARDGDLVPGLRAAAELDTTPRDGSARGAWPPDLAVVIGTGARLARRQPVEALAIVLLGLGGAILPFPFWLIGGFAAVMSRFYDVRDKWVAAAGPLLLALLGSVVTAIVVGGHDNPVVIYFHALRLDVGLLIRGGCLLCGWYLVRRLRRGPRLRVPPWQR